MAKVSVFAYIQENIGGLIMNNNYNLKRENCNNDNRKQAISRCK